MTEKAVNMEEAQNESFAELLEQSLKTLHTGEIVKGIITSMSANEVFVDLGTKTTGVIASDEFSDDTSYRVEDHFNIGDEIEAIVIKVNDMDGVATLSRKRIERNNNWSIIVDAYKDGTILEGKITDVVKGGLIIVLHSVRVFIPATHSGVPKDGDLNTLKGTTQQVKIIDLDESRNRAIASIRVVLREQRKAAEEEFWANIEEGKRYTGTVKSLKNYGAFIDLGGVNGMVHITELSWTRIKHPSEVLKEGQQVEVFVKSFDKEEGKISLGYKADEDDPWLKFTSQYDVNDVATVKILSLLPFGAFAEILPGVDGLIHISQIANRKIARPAEVLEIGQEVDAKIIEIDDENRKISLSIKALLDDDYADDSFDNDEE
ncbi:MAG: 30S ribosomal protein S1 [Clostridiales bacterium]|nr:30S ribosomal protein S1 [Clostridiales bacterium]